jgi:hypothetical protein
MRVKFSLRDSPGNLHLIALWRPRRMSSARNTCPHSSASQRFRDAVVRNGLADHLDSVRAIVNNSSHPRKPRHEVKLRHSGGSPRHRAPVFCDWLKRAPACVGFPRIPGNGRLNEIVPHDSAREFGSRDCRESCAGCWRGPAGNPLSSYSFGWLAGGTIPFIRRYSTIWPYISSECQSAKDIAYKTGILFCRTCTI